ncbi:DUF6265 family protein [Undibacterium cyanobacteriorum]|uniref:DUF6265 family protein n=1 Tax=Undibacterium cyanobacteriorum TaxID=3073561 RepID=A0ABY9RKW8_9BURK|nr:DUF6265 family protein [Undibacterium sp. 20NA77.5]WMW81842.1 DUF6265 family protein [Undibacterium sp. 20NA77.5]
MRNRFIYFAVLVMSSQQIAMAQESNLLAPVHWLAGCWSADGGEPGSGEHWMPAAGDTMIGVGRTIKNGKTVDYEFLQLKRGADGKLAFVALPSGQKEASFSLLSAHPDEVIFENLEHDFPQRIIYRREGNDRLKARIEGMRNNKLRAIDFPMSRAECK